jgi:hypothetical protein
VPQPIHDEPPTRPDTSVPVIEESPTGGFPVPEAPAPPARDSGPIEAPEEIVIPDSDGVPHDIDDGPSRPERDRTGRHRDPAAPEGPIVDEPAGPHVVPSDGVPTVVGDEPTSRPNQPAGEPTTRVPQRPHPDAPEPIVDEPTGRHVIPEEAYPVIDLPDGSVVYGADGRLFTRAEAEGIYQNMIAEPPYREARIMENVETGEHVVIQGTETSVKPDPDAFADYLRERLGPGTWRTLRHNHPVVETVGADGEARLITPTDERYPSGINGDLALAEADARATGQPIEATIDIVTEAGPAQIRYGYNPGARRPFWVEIPGPPRIREDFATLESYHEWYEGQTGHYYPPETHMEPGASTPRSRPPSDSGFRDGDVIFDPVNPLTWDQALSRYETLTKLSKDREALILENLDTGEFVIVQGSESVAKARPEEWAGLPKRPGDYGRWRGRRHYHGIDPATGATRREHQLPSGQRGDLEAARIEAEKFGRAAQSETLDIVVKEGDKNVRKQVEYGYNKSFEKPYWVHLPGEPRPHRFKDLLEYHVWFEQQTAHAMPYEIEAD